MRKDSSSRIELFLDGIVLSFKFVVLTLLCSEFGHSLILTLATPLHQLGDKGLRVCVILRYHSLNVGRRCLNSNRRFLGLVY